MSLQYHIFMLQGCTKHSSFIGVYSFPHQGPRSRLRVDSTHLLYLTKPGDTKNRWTSESFNLAFMMQATSEKRQCSTEWSLNFPKWVRGCPAWRNTLPSLQCHHKTPPRPPDSSPRDGCCTFDSTSLTSRPRQSSSPCPCHQHPTTHDAYSNPPTTCTTHFQILGPLGANRSTPPAQPPVQAPVSGTPAALNSNQSTSLSILCSNTSVRSNAMQCPLAV